MDYIRTINDADNLSELLRIKKHIFTNHVRIDISPFGAPILYFIGNEYHYYTKQIDYKIDKIINNIVTLN